MAVMDIIIKAIDQASDVIENVGKAGQQSAGWLEQNWAKVGVASGAAGVAMEAAARAQAPLTEQTKRLSSVLGMSEQEMRDLAISTANVTFPLEDALDLMETGRQRGLDSADALQKYATFWDTVGDATGLSSTQLAEAGVALKQVGVDAGNESEALAAFGYVTQETTGDIGDFLSFIERVGPELGDMGMDVNDSAAMLGILEHEMGMSGRMARQEFREAVNQADGSVEKLFETLGVSQDQFDEYSKKVEDSSGVIQHNADIHAESYTTMEKLQHAASEMTYKYGDLIGMVGNLSPIMMALGPIIKGVSLAKGALAAITSGSLIPALGGAITSAWSFTAALLANPITWIVILIAGLVAAIVLLWKNWDQVSEFLSNSWEWLKEKAGDFITGVTEWFSELPDKLLEFLTTAIDNISTWVSDSIDKAIEMGTEFLNNVVGFISQLPGRLWELLTTAINNVITWKNDMIQKAKEAGSNMLNEFMSFVTQLPGKLWEKFTEAIQKAVDWSTDLVNKAKQAGSDLLNGFMNAITDLPNKLWGTLKDTAGKLLNIGTTLWNNAKAAGDKIWSGFKKGLGIASPSYLEEAMQAIMEKSDDMNAHVTDEFNNLDPKMPQADFNLTSSLSSSGGIAENTPEVVEHRHFGTMRVVVENAQQGFEEIVDVVINEIRREVRA